MTLAVNEINRTGGVLGRPLAIVTRDVQNDPPAGAAALQDLVDRHHIVAVFGGIYSPVMIAQLDLVHRLRIPLINPWGSMAAITKNGRIPNYAFRVSVSDDEADEFLARYLVAIVGARKPGIIADTTGWGEANAKGLIAWTTRLSVPAVAVERFDQGDTDMSLQLRRLRAAGSDALLMVANAPEGAAIVRGLATLGWRPPVASHWGISGGRFVELGGVDNTDGILTLQTVSFYGALSPRARQVVQLYHQTFHTRHTDEILAPVGVATVMMGCNCWPRRSVRPAQRTALASAPPWRI
jgi:branched-chain amino acid transport system substrate-binding protein